jgi:hypothetical protein
MGKLAGFVAILGIISTPIIADLVTIAGLPVRSSPYFMSVVLLGLVGGALLRGLPAKILVGKIGTWLLVFLMVSVTWLGGAATNRSFLAASQAYEYDKIMAFTIYREIALLEPQGQPHFRLLSMGSWEMQHGTASLGAHHEAVGRSFFEFSSDQSYRMALFLESQGLPIGGVAAPEERRLLEETLRQMPSWPNKGWLQISGDIVLVRFPLSS